MEKSLATWRVEELSLRYVSRDGGAMALDGIDLDIRPGQVTILAGPSGSGKSSLLHCISGLRRPTSGRILFMGRDVTRLSQGNWARLRQDSIRVLSQHAVLFPYLTIWENLTMLVPCWRDALADEAHALLADLGLKGQEGAYPRQLSVGGRQRVALVRASIGTPAAILADEPTSALDAVHADQVMTILGRVARAGAAVVVATHDPAVMRSGGCQIHLREGKLLNLVPSGESRESTVRHGTELVDGGQI